MIVQVQACQDIVYRITQDELEKLKHPSRDYYTAPIVVRNERPFFLGHSVGDPQFEVPETQNLGDIQVVDYFRFNGRQFIVNLTTNAITTLGRGEGISQRIAGGTKLLIMLEQ